MTKKKKFVKLQRRFYKFMNKSEIKKGTLYSVPYTL